MSFFGAGKAIVEGLFHVAVLALAAYLAIHQRISFGDILTFSMLYLSAMAPLNEIHRVIDEGHEASLRVNDLIELLHHADRPVVQDGDATRRPGWTTGPRWSRTEGLRGRVRPAGRRAGTGPWTGSTWRSTRARRSGSPARPGAASPPC